ncbi:uncharacterized protein LOC131434792 [Malaya genurostris]|uniref:uncharacterized protein LOC131434792 n=1 Tax=Malaya genurostris TaxID=325434 RepID=UPI0026F40715|nr:uncharacterized protein LOC131434792 [Malaya genurostris]
MFRSIFRLMIALLVLLVHCEAQGDDLDFRVFDFGDEDTEFFSSYEKALSDHEYFPTDFNLGSLDLISSRASLGDPSKLEVARAKRRVATSEEHSNEADGDSDDGYGEDRYGLFVSRHFGDHDEGKESIGPEYEYQIDFNPSDDYERIKQESEAQSRRLAKDPNNCEQFEKDGMLCHVCRDPATDTMSESCAYATVPHHKKFSYVKQKNYNSKDHEKEKPDDEETAEEPPQRKRKPSKPKVIPTKKSVVHSKPGPKGTNGGGYRYPPVDLRSNKQRPKPPTETELSEGDTEYEFDTSFYPSYGRSQKLLQQAEPASSDDVYVLSYQDKDEVAKMLADFETRDWSNCKKATKNELTCYTCTDEDGVKHEECTYVSESRDSPQTQVLPTTTTTTPDSRTTTNARAVTTVVPTTETKRSHQKKATSEKRTTGPEVKTTTASSDPIFGKLLLVTEKLKPSEQQQQQQEHSTEQPDNRRQTIRRKITIKSHLDGSGLDPALLGDRVMHYEHHVTHLL